MNASDPHTHSKNAYRTLADMQIGVLEGHENDKHIDDEYKEPVDWDKPMLDQVCNKSYLYRFYISFKWF